MAVHIVRNSSSGGKGKIILGAILTLLFGTSAVSACREYLVEGEDSLIPFIACAAVAVAGILMVCSGIRGNRKRITVTNHEEDPEQILKIFRENSDSIQEQIESMRKRGISGTYQMTTTSRRVTRTTVNGTTTTETTEHITGGFPESCDEKDTIVTVTCKACGGLTQMKLQEIGACRFCGSKIRS